MKTCKISFSLICILFGLLCITNDYVYGHDSPNDYLDAHNIARSELGEPNLVWDETLEKYAQNYANQRKQDCQLIHSHGPYGENLAWSSSNDLSGVDAVKMWVDEKPYFNYLLNICADNQMCGHYTQVIWGNTLRVGCAKVICDNNGGSFITCNYDPPGNYIGERPY
ncbi:hypothetical protein HN51_057668 [Arachis hypogaea]|uniref:SCP domain-containing protein n=1 Tax=Arachis hypogaea TaxID=3818 RepID=A0A444WY03_ARAHY|nr:pathogenesis-related protein 1-like [Arachis ipaensis]XP_025683019.1 pathogenesis-related protein 1-like [Arachis hypogaea]QHN80446.1 Pathogenesis-related protein 1C [Arachis hypogaea]RYQ82283.1 hypothetical protein Ahy_B10g100877 [Arachis hypogaea]